VDGGIIIFSARSDNPIPDGQAWRLFTSGWAPFSPNVDIGARIFMNEGIPCTDDDFCDDGQFCNGKEICDTTTLAPAKTVRRQIAMTV
jgi:hypothetical protein